MLLYIVHMSASSGPYAGGPPVRKYNQRMAQRVARRAKLDEQGVAVCFAYNNLATSLVIGVFEDIARFVPTIGDLVELAIGLVTFYFHRIVLVTDQNVYVFRDWPFHIPGKRLAAYRRHPGVVALGSPNTGAFSRFIRRGQLNFEDGHVVYHGILWIRRARYIAEQGNSPAGWSPSASAMVPASVATPGAGWFPDPAGQPLLRWWDGIGWTAHTSPQPD